MSDQPTVLAWRDQRVGRLRLQRERALNALDAAMIDAIRSALELWRTIPTLHAVVIEAAGSRAFCAGGDIRVVRSHALAGETAAVESFFAGEYALNRAIGEYPKPYVALVDGICMGGGVGISVHGSARVATEAAVFAMPETGIGFFPDIGATFLLPRLPGALGMYVGLTSARMQGADAVHAGLATHFVRRERLPALAAALPRDGVAALAVHAEPLPAAGFAPHRAAIDRCFGRDSVPGILAALAAEESDWARETTAILRSRSPTSLFLTHAMLTAGATRDLPACLAAELALTRAVTRHPDFAEGVRAVVVDKDQAPRWSPACIEDVDPGQIAAMLAG